MGHYWLQTLEIEEGLKEMWSCCEFAPGSLACYTVVYHTLSYHFHGSN